MATQRKTHDQGGTTRKAIREMVRVIVNQFDPERIILFGSQAAGTPSPDSDVDLLVVMDYRGSKLDKQVEIRRALFDIPISKDILITTPEDFEWRRKVVGTIERPASRHGKVLYARS